MTALSGCSQREYLRFVFVLYFYRLICETMLEHEQMVYKNSKPFVRTFQLIRKIVGGVDYKVSAMLEQLLTFFYMFTSFFEVLIWNNILLYLKYIKEVINDGDKMVNEWCEWEVDCLDHFWDRVLQCCCFYFKISQNEGFSDCYLIITMTVILQICKFILMPNLRFEYFSWWVKLTFVYYWSWKINMKLRSSLWLCCKIHLFSKTILILVSTLSLLDLFFNWRWMVETVLWSYCYRVVEIYYASFSRITTLRFKMPAAYRRWSLSCL